MMIVMMMMVMIMIVMRMVGMMMRINEHDNEFKKHDNCDCTLHLNQFFYD